MIFYGEKQKSMLDEEQTVPDAIDTDDLDSDGDECDETSMTGTRMRICLRAFAPARAMMRWTISSISIVISCAPKRVPTFS